MMETKDKLFADLEALNEQQIEVGLAAGVWNEQVRPLVQHYLYDLRLKFDHPLPVGSPSAAKTAGPPLVGGPSCCRAWEY
jgi:hypothetical protein